MIIVQWIILEYNSSPLQHIYPFHSNLGSQTKLSMICRSKSKNICYNKRMILNFEPSFTFIVVGKSGIDKVSVVNCLLKMHLFNI